MSDDKIQRNDPYGLEDYSSRTDDENQAQESQPQGEESSLANESVPHTDNEEKNDVTEPTEPAESSRGDEASSISSDLIRGHINTIILRALYERDKYGYEIMTDIEHKSHGQYSLKQPTLYSALKRLENQGYIKAYWKTDEVSSGGRRKYFTLTDSGKEITEKNLAEWEYSRTIIDSLISDRSFDFSQPAPTPVDFTILRNSVSRVPVVRSDESDRAAQTGGEGVQPQASQVVAQPTEQTTTQVIVQPTEQPITQVVAQQPTEQTAAQVVAQTTEQTAQAAQQTTEQVVDPSAREVAQTVEQSTAQNPVQGAETTAQPSGGTEQAAGAPTPEEIAREDARRRAHENYMRLISEPVRQQPAPVAEDIVPNSENVNTDSLLYNNRPETERDYRNLIDGIFHRAVSNGSVQTTYTRSERPTPKPQPKARLVERGRADGVAVASSANYDVHTTYATKTTYNKGLTLLKCAAIVLAICTLEFIFTFVFLKQLATTWVYPVVILLLGLVQFSVFGVLALKGYGKNCVRPTTSNYLSTCIILTVLSILIISAAAFLFNVNPNSAADIMKMIVIPSITALNVTVFAVSFKLMVD